MKILIFIMFSVSIYSQDITVGVRADPYFGAANYGRVYWPTLAPSTTVNNYLSDNKRRRYVVDNPGVTSASNIEMDSLVKLHLRREVQELINRWKYVEINSNSYSGYMVPSGHD